MENLKFPVKYQYKKRIPVMQLYIICITRQSSLKSYQIEQLIKMDPKQSLK